MLVKKEIRLKLMTRSLYCREIRQVNPSKIANVNFFFTVKWYNYVCLYTYTHMYIDRSIDWSLESIVRSCLCWQFSQLCPRQNEILENLCHAYNDKKLKNTQITYIYICTYIHINIYVHVCVCVCMCVYTYGLM